MSSKKQGILALSNEVDGFGLPISHAEIARRVSCSREHVRQTLGNCGYDNFKQRLKAIKKRKSEDEKRICKPGYFTVIVNRWLKEIGFRYCSQCHYVFEIDSFTKGTPNRCKYCNVKCSNDWQKNNRERRNTYQRIYYKTKREAI